MSGLSIFWLICLAIFAPVIIGCIYGITNVKFKTVETINPDGTVSKKRVEDLSYDYKPEELWEPPPHFKDEFWQKNDPLVRSQVVSNIYSDDDWPHTENNT